MCLIAFAWRIHPDFPLVVAANRDEFFVRPARPARWWEHGGQALLSGQDEQAGGTWMGVTPGGRFAALTNHRDPAAVRSNAPSRGALVPHFLGAGKSTTASFEELQANARHFNGFNLLAFDGDTLGMLESREARRQVIEPGAYALSNASLDAPWPKQQRARAAMATALAGEPDVEALFTMLRSDRPAGDAQLPVTGVGLQWERMLSSAFIRAPGYGTRCSTVVLFGADGRVRFEERSWDAVGRPSGQVLETFQIQ
ncbi:MAG: NRDE family protein [Rhodocyclaceae bacterium]|nr:NRDE family protein [Rhodocyclaceae bacterium]